MLKALTTPSMILLLSAVTAFTLIWWYLMRDRLGMKPYMVVIVGIIVVIIGLFDVKLFALIEAGFQPEKAANMRLFGEVFLLPPVFYAMAKIFRRDPKIVFDVVVAGVCFSLLCGRFNCLHAGCCKGTLIPDTELRWPVREIEIVYYLIFLEISVARNLKKKTHGELYPAFMLSYGALRFVLEFFRETSQSGVFHIAHCWSALSDAIGLTVLLILHNKQKKGV